jgi:peptidoglycan/xylan/chitin deacetylase (PgdA/CDA1 family)
VKLLLLFVCRSIGLFRLAQWLTRDKLKILCYHGFALADEAKFRPKMFIEAKLFEQRLATIQRYRLRVLPLDEAVEKLYSRSLPKHAVAITIDDGLHSVRELAVPRLQHYGFAATVYVTTYYVEHPNPVFRLAVQYMFWKTRKRELVLNNVFWSADKTVDLSDPALKDRTAWDCINYGERQCSEEARVAMCETLGHLLEVPYAEIVRSRILHLMTPDELRSLAAANVSIELHTHRHTFPSDDPSRAQREIVDNRAAFKRWLDVDARHFCYPSGVYEERQWEWLNALAVKSSTTCDPGLNSPETPRHGLRRFLDGQNIHQLEFEAALTGFADLLRALRGQSAHSEHRAQPF